MPLEVACYFPWHVVGIDMGGATFSAMGRELSMDLSPSFKQFLADLVANDGERELRDGAESLPGMKTLEREGYIRLVPALCGPLGVRTGAFFAQITEAGRAAYAAALRPDLTK
jgi:hypothetical protein